MHVISVFYRCVSYVFEHISLTLYVAYYFYNNEGLQWHAHLEGLFVAPYQLPFAIYGLEDSPFNKHSTDLKNSLAMKQQILQSVLIKTAQPDVIFLYIFHNEQNGSQQKVLQQII